MVIGGTNINRERTGLGRGRCDVLVATPGRLQDHIETTDGFVGRLWGVQVRVGVGDLRSPAGPGSEGAAPRARAPAVALGERWRRRDALQFLGPSVAHPHLSNL
jgi:hypothetical protein